MEKSEKLTISLVIPAHNEEKLLSDCLKYALKNSKGLLKEIVVVDNASTDKTAEIALSFPGVRVAREEKKGVAHAKQRGYLETTGDILASVDADTHLPEGWVETVQNEFTKDPNLACLSGPYIYYDIPHWQQLSVKIYWYLAMPIYFLTGYMVVGGNYAIRKEVLDKMNGFDTTLSFYGEDTDIARRAHQFGKVLFKPSFIMYTSGRRFAEQGLGKTAWLYILNFFSQAIWHKTVSTEYKDIR
jgi:glycosyltransferase involved in cell wall biosynthesis